jgi:hypothetical protein
MNGMTVREAGPDADGPILEIHGDEGMAAVEIDDEAFVDGLTHAAAELKTELEAHDANVTDGRELSGSGCRACDEARTWKQGYCRACYLVEIEGWEDIR